MALRCAITGVPMSAPLSAKRSIVSRDAAKASDFVLSRDMRGGLEFTERSACPTAEWDAVLAHPAAMSYLHVGNLRAVVLPRCTTPRYACVRSAAVCKLPIYCQPIGNHPSGSDPSGSHRKGDHGKGDHGRADQGRANRAPLASARPPLRGPASSLPRTVPRETRAGREYCRVAGKSKSCYRMALHRVRIRWLPLASGEGYVFHVKRALYLSRVNRR